MRFLTAICKFWIITAMAKYYPPNYYHRPNMRGVSLTHQDDRNPQKKDKQNGVPLPLATAVGATGRAEGETGDGRVVDANHDACFGTCSAELLDLGLEVAAWELAGASTMWAGNAHRSRYPM